MTATNRRVDSDHEELVFCKDPATGSKSISTIHDKTPGSLLGRVRMWRYSLEDQALEDVVHLSWAMAYKPAIADLYLGGGKAVINGDPSSFKTDTSWFNLFI